METLRCGQCLSPLSVDYVEETVEVPAGPQHAGHPGPAMPVPVHAPAAMVTLGEGNTPVIPLPWVAQEVGLRSVYAKLEYVNPTGSFKDRGTAMVLSVAREHGVTEIVEDSSGNAGASISAYAARAGIGAHVFAPSSAPAAKLQQIKVYGAQVHLVPGPRQAATDAAVAYAAERGLVYASHSLSPYFTEGTKAFAYEVAQQLAGRLPSHIVFPVGNGGLFLGAWTGFGELQRRGLIGRVPHLHCVQARAVMPIVAAYYGQEWTARPDARTVAGGISVGAPPRMEQVLDVLRSTGGSAVAADDDDILRWQRLLAEREGVYAEPTSAAALAGLEQLVAGGVVSGMDVVLVPITGFGLKDAPPQ